MARELSMPPARRLAGRLPNGKRPSSCSTHVVAVASDVGAEELAPDCPLPVLPINEPARIAEFILDYLDAR